VGGAGRKALGWFLEFRLIPVLLWSYTAVALGTGVAFLETGSFRALWLAVALSAAGFIQGWSTHAINEIYDWRSGTDQDGSPRALSGGSKVVRMGLLDERDLWVLFAFATGVVVALSILVAIFRGAWLVLLVASGYVLGVVYTLPPFATSYRPFAGEWLGGFPGVIIAGLGAYAIQALAISWVAVAALAAHALVCVGMLTMHSYLDVAADAHSRPMKRTTVVALGPRGARRYAILVTAGAAILYAGLAWLVHFAFALAAVFAVFATWAHARADPTDLRSTTRHELQVIQLGIAGGLATAVVLAPFLWPLLPIAAAGYVVHLAVVAPPAELARAWRRTSPAEHGRTK